MSSETTRDYIRGIRILSLVTFLDIDGKYDESDFLCNKVCNLTKIMIYYDIFYSSRIYKNVI